MKIGLVVYEHCMPAGLFAAADVLQAVNRRAGNTVFSHAWIGAGVRGLGLPGGCSLDLSKAPALDCDAYLLPGFWAESASALAHVLERSAPVLDWLRALPPDSSLWSYCMGVALLAESGLLRGRGATATWWLEAALRQRYPQVDWNFLPSLHEDGAILSAAGANGFWPLLQNRMSAMLAPAVWQDVEQALFIPRAKITHPAFRPVDMLAQTERRVRRLLAYVQTIPATELSVDLAARHVAVSTRTLSRLIQHATGSSVGQWLRLVKLAQVGQALLSSDAPAALIGERLGYLDEASLMRAFKRETGMTMSEYRQKFAHTLAP